MKKLCIVVLVLALVAGGLMLATPKKRVTDARRAHPGAPKSAQDMGAAFGKAVGGLIAGGGNR